jgi:hypothetical protein
MIASLDLNDVLIAASAIAAWIALCVGIFSSWTAKRALALAREQDSRRRPKLVPYLANAYFVRTDNSRIFTYSISVTNPSDIDNSLARIELEVSYETNDGLRATIRLPQQPELVSHLRGHRGRVIAAPEGVNAHQAIAGWLLFELKDDLLGGAKIDGYAIILEDSHQIATRLEPGISRELRHEEKAGNDRPV